MGKQSGRGALRTGPAKGGVGKKQGQEPQATQGPAERTEVTDLPLSPLCLCSFPHFDFPRIKETQHSDTYGHSPPAAPAIPSSSTSSREKPHPAFLDPHIVLLPLSDPVASLPPLGVPLWVKAPSLYTADRSGGGVSTCWASVAFLRLSREGAKAHPWTSHHVRELAQPVWPSG